MKKNKFITLFVLVVFTISNTMFISNANETFEEVLIESVILNETVVFHNDDNHSNDSIVPYNIVLPCTHVVSMGYSIFQNGTIKFNILNTCFSLIPCGTPVYYTLSTQIKTPGGSTYPYVTRTGSAYPGVSVSEEIYPGVGISVIYSLTYEIGGSSFTGPSGIVNL